MSHVPEDDLARHLKKQAQDLHSNLTMINQLFELCSDETLSEKNLLKQALPIVQKLSESNPAVAKELKEVLSGGNMEKIATYFEQEKEALLQSLTTEIKAHKEINRRINKETNEDQPTDS